MSLHWECGWQKEGRRRWRVSAQGVRAAPTRSTHTRSVGWSNEENFHCNLGFSLSLSLTDATLGETGRARGPRSRRRTTLAARVRAPVNLQSVRARPRSAAALPARSSGSSFPLSLETDLAASWQSRLCLQKFLGRQGCENGPAGGGGRHSIEIVPRTASERRIQAL